MPSVSTHEFNHVAAATAELKRRLQFAAELAFVQNAAGAVPGPVDCFLLLRGVRTLGLRMDRHCQNAREVVGLLTEHPEVDVVLMDTMMPDLDGNDTTRRIRALPGGRDLPVVFLTAKAMPGDREASLAAGATEYVTKPVDLDELLALMANWVTPPRRPRRGLR